MLSNNKNAQMSFLIIPMLILLMGAVLLILIGGILTIKFYDSLHQDVEIGQVNLQNVTEDSFGYFKTMYINSAEWWGLSIIFGMVIGIFLTSYLTRNSIPKWGIILDIFIIIGTFILCLYISGIYADLLESMATANETFLEDYTPKTSMFILNLHIFSVIIGAIAMFLFHSTIPKKKEEEYQSGGYLQGV